MMLASTLTIIIGAIVTFIYLWNNQPYERSETGDTSNTGRCGPSYHDIPDSKDLFTLKYEQINERVRSRENVTVVVGSIFVTASVLLLGSSVDLKQGTNPVLKDALLLASLALYAIWLLAFSLPANKLSSIELHQLRQMEKSSNLGVNVHTYLWDEIRNKSWYKHLRRQIWLYPFWVLILAAVLIMEIV